MTERSPSSSIVYQALLARRSVKLLSDVGPTDHELALLVRAAATVPDHGELKPYRFVIVRGEGRGRFGDALAAAALEAKPDLPKGLVEKTRAKAFAGPAQIVLVASPRDGMKIPEWEQITSASCTGFAIVLAADALGLGAIWKTSNFQDGAALRDVLGLTSGERMLGWVNVGRPAEDARSAPRDEVDVASFATELTVAGRHPFHGRA